MHTVTLKDGSTLVVEDCKTTPEGDLTYRLSDGSTGTLSKSEWSSIAVGG